MAGAFCVELQKAHRRHDLLFCLVGSVDRNAVDRQSVIARSG